MTETKCTEALVYELLQEPWSEGAYSDELLVLVGDREAEALAGEASRRLAGTSFSATRSPFDYDDIRRWRTRLSRGDVTLFGAKVLEVTLTTYGPKVVRS